jgi:hypothetical protein
MIIRRSTKPMQSTKHTALSVHFRTDLFIYGQRERAKFWPSSLSRTFATTNLQQNLAVGVHS